MRFVMIMMMIALSGCATKPAPFPPRADVIALTEAKPRPPASILTDPAASDLHNSKIEGWADRLSSAGKRLCQFFDKTGMPGLDCP